VHQPNLMPTPTRSSAPLWCFGYTVAVVVVTACCTRYMSCVPASRLEDIESKVYTALDSSVASIRKQNEALVADNAELRRKLAERRRLRSLGGKSTVAADDTSLSTSALSAAASSTTAARLCGVGVGAAVQSSLRWKNKHGKFVTRTVSAGDGRLSICKRSRDPELQLRLAPTTSVSKQDSGSSAFQLRVQPAGDRATVLQFTSAGQRDEWAQALLRTAASEGATAAVRASNHATATSDAPTIAADAVSPTVAGGDRDASAQSASIATCHQRAIQHGAHQLSHTAALLTRQRRRRFNATCAAAFEANRLAARAHGNGGEPPGKSSPPPLKGAQVVHAVPSLTATGGRYLRFDRTFAHGLGHEVLVHNLGVRLAAALNLTLVFEPLLSSSERGDHSELLGLSGKLEAILGLGRGEVGIDARLKGMPTTWLGRPCPGGARKHLGGSRTLWSEAVERVRHGGSRPAVYRMCGDVSGVVLDGVGGKDSKYYFGSTGAWWRAKMAAAESSAPGGAHATPLFDAATAAAGTGTGADVVGGGRRRGGGDVGGSPALVHVAVHIRRGDMVYRNFYKQLSPDAYYVNAMWHALTLLRRRRSAMGGAGATPAATAAAALPPPPQKVVFHVFSQPPPRSSWTGKSKVPLDGARGAAYVDELGCAASLRAQLASLAAANGDDGREGTWDLRMHLDADPVESILHMAKADALIASDSSFSLVAAVLSRGLVFSRDGWKRFSAGARSGMLRPITLTDDGAFDCAEAARLLGGSGS
jgi:hypothetical protein